MRGRERIPVVSTARIGKKMSSKKQAANHYSHSFELKLDKLPVRQSDRAALRFLYPGIFSGLVLMAIGLYDMFSDMNSEGVFFPNLNVEEYHSFLNPAFFDIGLVLAGLGLVIILFSSYLKYRKIIFDGKEMKIIDRQTGGKKTVYKDLVKNYEGVQFRMEFFQLGFMTKTRYIIELLHKNVHKTAPLYISTNGKGIRKKWKYYAKAFQLPALVLTAEGLERHNVEDLDKTIIALAEEGKIHSGYDAGEALPPFIVLVRKRDKKVLKMAKILWDVYNIFTLGIIAAAALVCLLLAFAGGDSAIVLWLDLAIVLFLGGMLYLLFRRDKIAIKKHKIIVVHKFPFGNFKKDEIYKDKIEAVEVAQNPQTGRFYLAISSDDKTVLFGKKLPAETLQWAKKYLIYDLCKK